MQVLRQLVGLYISISLVQIDLLIFTILSLVLTFIAMFKHVDVLRFKTGLPRFNKSKYFWLNVTSVIILTGLPIIALDRSAIFIIQGSNPTLWMIFTNITLNAPGIIYFVIASSILPMRRFKFKLPKYL